MHATLTSCVPHFGKFPRQRIKNGESDAESRLETARRHPATKGIRVRNGSPEDSINLSLYRPETQYVAAAWRDNLGDDGDDGDVSSRRVLRTRNSGMI